MVKRWGVDKVDTVMLSKIFNTAFVNNEEELIFDLAIDIYSISNNIEVSCSYSKWRKALHPTSSGIFLAKTQTSENTGTMLS